VQGHATCAFIPLVGCSQNNALIFILPPYHLSNPPNNDRSQNDLPFSSLYSLALSWNLQMQKSFNITSLYNILETIREFIYIYSLVFCKTLYM
jgi:hypothetical protein